MPFSVHKYSKDTLKELLAKFSKAEETKIDEKRQSRFLGDYLLTLDCQTIIAECDYLDKDYSRDHFGYYVHSFTEYSKFCTRLHFFTQLFDKGQFEDILNTKEPEDDEEEPKILKEFKESYCGFIVVKPLPKTMIGRTCLKLSPNDGQVREYPAKREYKASLYGIPLKIETLAFQEQDEETSRCATSAVWSVLQKTGCLFHHKILSPIEITQAATLGRPNPEPVFPNHGLDPGQVADVIRSVGLEALVLGKPVLSEKGLFREIVYAYLHMGIPVFLGMDMVDITGSEPEYIGPHVGSRASHAIAITGYSFPKSVSCSPKENGFRSFASGIDTLYGHDDRVGPFAPFKINDTEIEIKSDANDIVDMTIRNENILDVTIRKKKTYNMSLHTKWKSDKAPEKVDAVRAIPTVVVIPLYSKIRIHYIDVRRMVEWFDWRLDLLREEISFPKLEWKIFLTHINDMKKDIRKSDPPPVRRLDILTQGMPQYVWRSQGLHQNRLIIELIYDATESPQRFSELRYLKPILYDLKFFPAFPKPERTQ